jgi:hypothetical protein
LVKGAAIARQKDSIFVDGHGSSGNEREENKKKNRGRVLIIYLHTHLHICDICSEEVTQSLVIISDLVLDFSVISLDNISFLVGVSL